MQYLRMPLKKEGQKENSKEKNCQEENSQKESQEKEITYPTCPRKTAGGKRVFDREPEVII